MISHGPDQQGGITLFGNNAVSVPCDTDPFNIQQENCENEAAGGNNAIFLETLVREDGSFDDRLIYSAERNADEAIPSGAVMAFTTQFCPKGWTVFEEARGRFIMGATHNRDSTNSGINPDAILVNRMPRENPAGTSINLDIDPISGLTETEDRSYGIETTNDASLATMRDNIPPSVALLYCRKN